MEVCEHLMQLAIGHTCRWMSRHFSGGKMAFKSASVVNNSGLHIGMQGRSNQPAPPIVYTPVCSTDAPLVKPQRCARR